MQQGEKVQVIDQISTIITQIKGYHPSLNSLIEVDYWLKLDYNKNDCEWYRRYTIPNELHMKHARELER